MADIEAEVKDDELVEQPDDNADAKSIEDSSQPTPRPSFQEQNKEPGHDHSEEDTSATEDRSDKPANSDGGMTEVPLTAIDKDESEKPDPNQALHSRASTLSNPPVLQSSALTDSPERTLSPFKPSSPQSPGRLMRGLSGEFIVTSPPPPSSSDRQHAIDQRQIGARVVSPPPPGTLTRKTSTGFGAFLGRMGTMRKSTRSPSETRRDTAASLASVDSNGLASIADTADGESGIVPRPSLQDQFTSLRKMSEYSPVIAQEETFVTESLDESGLKSPVTADGQPPSSPPKSLAEKRISNPSILMSPPMNPSLPPGTATGMTAGPAEAPQDVNWDLWQQLVYDGPSAVTRTSGEELREAISSGIPPAIRGVVWQVLAGSKSDELEAIYRSLKAKGTEGERPALPARNPSTVSVAAPASEKDGQKSERSSVHSDNSTAAYSRPASPPTSVDSASQDLQVKLEAEKRKREAAALQKLEKAIKRDLGARTSFSKYTQSPGLQDGLFGVCKAYALYDEGVGYAQGINFIAMPLLFNMSEEEAFTLLVRLMGKYDVRSMFTAEMQGLHLRLHHFERLLEDYEPAVSCHLRRRHVSPQLYATPWFLTLFAYRFPLQLVLRVYDLIFSEGLTAILKFGIVLMQRNRDALLAMKDMSQLTTFLKEKLFDVYIDQSPSASSLLDSGFFGSVTGGADRELYRAEEMVRDACQIHISDETLAQYTAEWEETQRTERGKELELESLRTGNISLTAQVKSLEERVQQHDTEHVRIAQDLVRIKVENDALQDSNEALKLQVTELQRLLDCQPAEIEAKLKEEMERIMQRNIEVQNENRALKEEMDEMEHVLVNAKMSQAQTQSDHDSLKQRWASVQALLNVKASS